MKRFLFLLFFFLTVNIFAADIDFTDGEGIDSVDNGTLFTVDCEDATDSNKGCASFASGDFDVSSGAVSLDTIDIADDTDLSVNTPLLLSGSTITMNDIALSTDTSGNYVATVADAGNTTITVSGSGSEGAAVTLDAVDLNCTDCIGGTEIGTLDIADDTDLTVNTPLLLSGSTITLQDVVLGTKTSGNYVATVADAGNTTITVSGSGSETSAVTLDAIDLNCTDCINATEIEDIYTLTAGDTVSGILTVNRLIANSTTTDLSDVSVTGSMALTGHASCVELETDASGKIVCAADDAGGGSPGGSDTQVQFNDSSAFGGDAGLTFNKTTDELTIAGTGNMASLEVSGTISMTTLDCSGNANGGALTADANGNISCTDDDGGGASGDIVTVNSTAIDTTANFLDGDIDFTVVDGGAGGPDDITATVGCTGCVDTADISDNTVALADVDHSITLAGNPALAASQCFWSSTGLICEGSTADTIETLLTFSDPLSSDKTITFPSATGDVAVTSSTGLIARTAGQTHQNRTITAGSNNGVTISNGNGVSGNPTISLATSASLSGDHSLSANGAIFGANGIIFEGATANTIEAYFSITDPTSTDKTYTFPDATGEVSLLGQTIAAAEMADADHGDVSWSSGTATVEDLQCTDCIGTTEIADSYLLNTDDTMTGDLTVTATLTALGMDVTGTMLIPYGNDVSRPCKDGEIIIDNDATSGQRLYACESGAFVVQGDGTGGTTNWDTIGDPTGAGSVDFNTNQQTILGSVDTSGGIMLRLHDDDSIKTNDTVMLALDYDDDDDENAIFLRAQDNIGGVAETVFQLGPNNDGASGIATVFVDDPTVSNDTVAYLANFTDNGDVNQIAYKYVDNSGADTMFQVYGEGITFTSDRLQMVSTTDASATCVAVDSDRVYGDKDCDEVKDAGEEYLDIAGSGSPGGSDTQIQYNNSSSFGGVSVLTYDGTELTMSGTMTTSGSLVLPQSTNCAGWTEEGSICWDTDDDTAYVGDGSTASALGGGADTNSVKEYWWSASSTMPLTTAGTLAPISTDTGTNLDPIVVAFDDSDRESRMVSFKVPSDVTSGSTITFRSVWYSPTATTGNALWVAQHTSGDSEGESWDSSLTDECATADAVQGTVDQITTTTWTETLSNLGWAANDLVSLWFTRDGLDTCTGSDTITGDIYAIGFGVEIPRE